MVNGAMMVEQASRLAPKKALLLLAHLVHEVTVITRCSYEFGGEGLSNPARVRALNEIQHRIAGALVDVAADHKRQFRVVDIAESMLAPRGDDGLTNALATALKRALERI